MDRPRMSKEALEILGLWWEPGFEGSKAGSRLLDETVAGRARLVGRAKFARLGQ